MKVSGELAALIFHILTFEDSIDKNGNKKRLDSFPTKHYRVLSALEEEIKNKSLQIMVKAGDISEQRWLFLEEFNSLSDADKEILGERFVDSEIEISDNTKSAVSDMFKKHENLPKYLLKGLGDLEKLVGK